MTTNNITLPNTLMDTTVKYELPAEKREELIDKMDTLLSEYDYDHSRAGAQAIIDNWVENKGWLIDLFSKHPNYNGNFQIVLPKTLKRPVDREKVNTFIGWASEQMKRALPEQMIGLHTMADYMKAMDALYKRFDRMDYVGNACLYNGFTTRELRAEYHRMEARLSASNKRDCTSIMLDSGRVKYITDADYGVLRAWERLMHKVLYRAMEKEVPNIITESDVEYCAEYANKLGVPMIAGQRVTKYIRKVLVKFGIDKVVDMKRQEWFDDNGNHHSEMKDMGYNYHFALLGDGINPIDIPSEIVLSVNPIDYWTMSFGWKWASCHTIDKENRRGVDGNHYEGCFSSGTSSYMGDRATIIVYSRPDNKHLEDAGETDLPLEMQSKMKRCVFYLGEDKLVQSRLYPDGRDGGDAESLSGQFRNIVQETIAGLYDTPNLWKLETGASACRDVVVTASSSTHYPDYRHYDDCTVSYLRRVDGLMNTNAIIVGSTPICPNCGRRHIVQEWITCESCRNPIECDDCGDICDERDMIQVGEYTFCCAECAENHGFVFTYDTQEWRREDFCTQESGTERWFYHDGDGVDTEDGSWFHDASTAIEHGYRYCDLDGVWVSEDEAQEIGATNTYFQISEHPQAVETEDGMCYPNPESARFAGYYHNEEDDIWIHEEGDEDVW